MKLSEMNIDNTPVSHWPRSVYDVESGEIRVVTYNRADQLCHPDTFYRTLKKYRLTEKYKAKARAYQRNYRKLKRSV